MEGLTLIEHQLYARDCSKCFVYMNQLPLQGRYYHSLFSGEETKLGELRKLSKVAQLVRGRLAFWLQKLHF